jgi:hypothetical protein
MLGVHRSSVSLVANTLNAAGQSEHLVSGIGEGGNLAAVIEHDGFGHFGRPTHDTALETQN